MNGTPHESLCECPLRRQPTGFTIVEMLVALAILGIVSTAAFGIFVSLSRGYTRTNVAAESQQDLRLTIDFMVRDIRMAGLDPLKSRVFGITTALNDSLIFTADRNLNGDLELPDEQIAYQFAGGTLTMNDGGATATLCDGITDFVFTYFDDDGAVTNDAEQVRSVAIRVATENPAGGNQRVARAYSTRVRCRNLGL